MQGLISKDILGWKVTEVIS